MVHDKTWTSIFRFSGLGAFFWLAVISTQAKAQTEELDLDSKCPIPYTVEKQQTIAQAYLAISNKIGNALPIDTPAGALEAFYGNVRTIVAGEALQALSDVRAAYVCRLKATLPENKHAHLNAITREVARITAQAFLPNNWNSMTTVGDTYDYVDGRIASPPASLKNIPTADRITSAEILTIIGNPNFKKRSETRLGIEATFANISGGACLGTVRASLATLDNASIAALAAHHTVLADAAEDALRPVAYERILTDAQSIFAPGATTQIAAQINAANNKTKLKSCLLEGSETPTIVVDQDIQQNNVIEAVTE